MFGLSIYTCSVCFDVNESEPGDETDPVLLPRTSDEVKEKVVVAQARSDRSPRRRWVRSCDASGHFGRYRMASPCFKPTRFREDDLLIQKIPSPLGTDDDFTKSEPPNNPSHTPWYRHALHALGCLKSGPNVSILFHKHGECFGIYTPCGCASFGPFGDPPRGTRSTTPDPGDTGSTSAAKSRRRS